MAAKLLPQLLQPVEIWFIVALLYLLLTSVLSQLIAWVERRLAVSD